MNIYQAYIRQADVYRLKRNICISDVRDFIGKYLKLYIVYALGNVEIFNILQEYVCLNFTETVILSLNSHHYSDILPDFYRKCHLILKTST